MLREVGAKLSLDFLIPKSPMGQGKGVQNLKNCGQTAWKPPISGRVAALESGELRAVAIIPGSDPAEAVD